jgi:hypothetical protein
MKIKNSKVIPCGSACENCDSCSHSNSISAEKRAKIIAALQHADELRQLYLQGKLPSVEEMYGLKNDKAQKFQKVQIAAKQFNFCQSVREKLADLKKMLN